MITLQSPLRRMPHGSALIAVLVLGLIMGLITMSLIQFGYQKRRETARLVIYNAELNAAENAIERFVAQIRFASMNRVPQAWNTEGGMAGFIEEGVGQVADTRFNVGFAIEPIVEASTDGLTLIDDTIIAQIPELVQWRDYFLNLDSYRIVAGALAYTEASGLALANQFSQREGIYVSRTVNFYLVPLLNYAIFYQNDLELDAGQRMDIFGKVHTNGNWYLTTSSSAHYHDFVTVAGNFYGGIYHPLDTRRTWSGRDDVFIADRVGSTPGSAAASTTRLKSNGISINNGWLSSVNYNGQPGNPNAWTPNPDWVDDARSMYNGILRDRSHGVETVRLPIGEDTDPAVLLQPPVTSGTGADTELERESKLAYQASLIIETRALFGTSNPVNDSDSVASWSFDNASSVSNYLRSYQLVPDSSAPGGFREEAFDLTYYLAGDDPTTQPPRTFVEHVRIWNGREEKFVDMVDIDMERFQEYLQSDTVTASGGAKFNMTGNANPNAESAMLYVHASPDTVAAGHQPAARIRNASDLSGILAESGLNPSHGMSIATNAPLYTLGDVNSGASLADGRIPLMLMGDSINILSNSFSDTHYLENASGNGARRNASSATTTNAVFVSGNVPTRPNQYSGGGENFFRYIESWGGSRTHNFRGSMLNLFESQIATAPWDKNTGQSASSGYYDPPRRNWGWDPEFAAGNTPPGMPTSTEYSMGQWQMLTRAEYIAMGGPQLDLLAQPPSGENPGD